MEYQINLVLEADGDSNIGVRFHTNLMEEDILPTLSVIHRNLSTLRHSQHHRCKDSLRKIMDELLKSLLLEIDRVIFTKNYEVEYENDYGNQYVEFEIRRIG